MPEFNITFTYNGPESISISLPSAIVTLGTADIDKLIYQLAKFRMQMSPEIDRGLGDGEHGLGIVDPLWKVASHPAAQEKTVFVRHTGFGWQMFLFPPAEAVKLGRALLQGQSPETGGPQGPSPLHH